jgi:hypothetical protein
MRLRGNGLTLTGPEGKSPPLPFVTVEDAEGEALIALYPKSIINIDALAVEVEAIVNEPEAGAPTVESAGDDILLGSSIQPAMVAIGDIEVPLGTIVAAACGKMTSAEWNALTEDEREARIAGSITQAREFAGRDENNDIVGTTDALDDASDDAGNEGAHEPDAGGEEGATRRQAIADAIDLLDDDGFVKTGERAGRPKVKAVADVLDDPNVTAEEIDAVFAERESE